MFRLLVATFLLLAFSISGLVAQGNSQVRFVHVIPNATAIDVYVNGTRAIANLNYANASTYITVPAGNHTVTVTPAGITSLLWEQPITAEADKAATLIASSPTALKFDIFQDNLTTLPLGQGRLLLIHAIAGAPPVDVQLAEAVTLGTTVQNEGTPLATAMAYATSFGAFDLPSQSYPVNVLANGADLLSDIAIPVTSNTFTTALVYGTADLPQVLLLTAPTVPAANTGRLRLVHGVVGAPAVDVYINDILVAPGLTIERPTEHIDLPAGEHTVILRAAGTEDEIFNGGIAITAGTAATAVVLQGETEIELKAYEDAVSASTPDRAIISVVNTIPGTESVDVALPDGTPLASEVAFGSASNPVSLSPMTIGLVFTVTIADMSGVVDVPAETFYGGVYYNLIALDGGAFSAPRLIVAKTGLTQELTSAPGGGATLAIAPTQAPTAAAPQPTAASVAGSEVVTNPTAQPQALPPVVTEEDTTIYGRLLLDPGANLQLREYPRSDARSLGLAPAGTTLVVNGREGAPVALVEGQEPPPEAADFVDPATLLDPTDEKADLVKETTWLNVSFATPDGGSITAWVNALYVDVRNAENEALLLKNLPLIGGNIPGSAQATAVTPPPIPEDTVTAVVINLNQGTNLNIRRTPTAEGEVLARLPLGTVVEFTGLLETEDWAFVVFRPAEGGSISGWVNTLYIEYRLNNTKIELEDLKEAVGTYTGLPLFQFVEAERRGAISGSVPSVTVPTPDPLEDVVVAEVRLNEGANLQLRRTPDPNSESLNLIPNGTQLIVTSRTTAGDWLNVTFEGESGWISSLYVVLTFNGDTINVNDIPVQDATVPQATPTIASGG
jgi:uncharacterized protein YgiM (DUF1202 family)